MNVGPLRFGVELTPVEGVQGEYKLCHIQDCKDIVWSAPDHSEAFPVPNCAIFKPDDYVTLSNIKYDQILPAIKAFPVNAHTYGVANQIMLNLIAASDKADGTRKEILLQTALSIADWLASLPDDVWEKSIATLNRMQIIKRQRSLTEEERGMLYALALGIGSREDVRFAAYALLGKRDEAIKHFSTLPPSAQEELKLYPIYRFAEMSTVKKKANIIARQLIINPTTGKPHDDQGLYALDGIMYGSLHIVDEQEDNNKIMHMLIKEFEEKHPDFHANSYELITKLEEA